MCNCIADDATRPKNKRKRKLSPELSRQSPALLLYFFCFNSKQLQIFIQAQLYCDIKPYYFEQPLHSFCSPRQACYAVQCRKQRVVPLSISLHLRFKRVEGLHRTQGRPSAQWREDTLIKHLLSSVSLSDILTHT